ncbi:hypothetical protein HYC85_028625 [Camellia sinensis]|uniref:Uncharacterized protein n=1 Tax=Camellia sinensis TaxID=4442 RepID=A0A7J7FZQ5_CAMSI|nr:hypothetical protein HYC85_028625 [Camellia sinensis]
MVPFFLFSPEEGSRSALLAATDPDILKCCTKLKADESPVCSYISYNCRPMSPSNEAHRTGTSQLVWEKTLDMVGLPADAVEMLLEGKEIKCRVMAKLIDCQMSKSGFKPKAQVEAYSHLGWASPLGLSRPRALWPNDKAYVGDQSYKILFICFIYLFFFFFFLITNIPALYNLLSPSHISFFCNPFHYPKPFFSKI